jgi:hypothetical protein
MRVVRPVFTGMALAIAGIVTFSMADTALAKTKKHEETSTTQSQPSHSAVNDCVHTPFPQCSGGNWRRATRIHKHKSHGDHPL